MKKSTILKFSLLFIYIIYFSLLGLTLFIFRGIYILIILIPTVLVIGYTLFILKLIAEALKLELIESKKQNIKNFDTL